MSTPPPLPTQVLARVVRVATFDGRSVLVLAGLCVVVTALLKDVAGTLASAVAASAAMLELHGCHRLRSGDARGVSWLVRSQLFLLVVILVYAVERAMSFDPAWVHQQLTPDRLSMIEQGGLSVDQLVELIRLAVQIGYSTVAVVAVLYQGGLAFYFARQRRRVEIALQPKSERGAE